MVERADEAPANLVDEMARCGGLPAERQRGRARTADAMPR